MCTLLWESLTNFLPVVKKLGVFFRVYTYNLIQHKTQVIWVVCCSITDAKFNKKKRDKKYNVNFVKKRAQSFFFFSLFKEINLLKGSRIFCFRFLLNFFPGTKKSTQRKQCASRIKVRKDKYRYVTMDKTKKEKMKRIRSDDRRLVQRRYKRKSSEYIQCTFDADKGRSQPIRRIW